MYDCVILAAGISKRMGRHKAFLPFDRSNTFLERIVGIYLDIGVIKPIVVTNESVLQLIKKEDNPQFEQCQFVLNNHLNRGRFYSLKLGLGVCKLQHPVFIQNIDNPFVDQNLLKGLINNLQDDIWVVPSFNQKSGHPILLSSFIAKKLLNEFSDESVLYEVLKLYGCQKVEVSNPNILLNINTPEDYKDFLMI